MKDLQPKGDPRGASTSREGHAGTEVPDFEGWRRHLLKINLPPGDLLSLVLRPFDSQA